MESNKKTALTILLVVLLILMFGTLGGYYMGVTHVLETGKVIAIGDTAAWISFYGEEILMDIVRY